jgi:hypothetical protein
MSHLSPSFLSFFFFSFFFFCGTGVWTQGLTLARQALYHLIYSVSPFIVMDFFGDRVSQTICQGLVSNCYPLDLCLLSHWDYRCEPLVPGSPLSFFRAFLLSNSYSSFWCQVFPLGRLHGSSVLSWGLSSVVCWTWLTLLIDIHHCICFSDSLSSLPWQWELHEENQHLLMSNRGHCHLLNGCGSGRWHDLASLSRNLLCHKERTKQPGGQDIFIWSKSYSDSKMIKLWHSCSEMLWTVLANN